MLLKGDRLILRKRPRNFIAPLISCISGMAAYISPLHRGTSLLLSSLIHRI